MQSREISPAIPGLHPGYTRKEPTMSFVTDIKTFTALGTGNIGHMQIPMITQTILLNDHIRIDLENNI